MGRPDSKHAAESARLKLIAEPLLNCLLYTSLTFAPDPEIMALFENRTGPLAFADAQRVVAAVAVEFPHVTVEHVHVGLKILAQGGWVEWEYRLSLIHI